MASVTSATSDKTNGIVGKPGVEKPKTAARPDGEDGEEGAEEGDEDDEEDEYEEADDEDERQMAEDDEDDEDDDQDEEGEDQGKPQSLTHFLIGNPEGPEDNDNDNEQDEEDTEDVYIPPVPETISRKRSHQEVAGDDEEPDSKKAKA